MKTTFKFSVSTGSSVNEISEDSFSELTEAVDFFNAKVAEFTADCKTELDYSPTDEEMCHAIQVTLWVALVDEDGDVISETFANSQPFFDDNF